MDERELRAFLCVATTGRMDLAAKALGYSQPAISYQIKCLEKSLGFRLFTRDSTGARLTRDGRMILPAVQAAVMLIDEIRQTAPRATANSLQTWCAAGNGDNVRIACRSAGVMLGGEQWECPGSAAADPLGRFFDFVRAVEAEHPTGEVPERGHGLWTVRM
jgi:hypothetical protein